MTYDIREGDCLSVMATMDAESVDSIVSDPPYGLAFMGKAWDHGVPGVPFWAEALRVAKPGAFLVAFGGSRTYHRLTCAIEDAGWEIRDCLSWLYGSGFPKSLDIGKAMDKASGEKRERIPFSGGIAPGQHKYGSRVVDGTRQSDAPISDLAREWHGWGTALKPAWEPIILARKPLAGTVASNVAQYGTGGINVDGCRIEGVVPSTVQGQSSSAGTVYGADQRDQRQFVGNPAGRWPANVVLDEEAAGMLDAQSGNKGGGLGVRGRGGKTYANGEGFANSLGEVGQIVGYGDPGGASRFFYTAKASRKEREAGLEGMPEREYPVAVIQTVGVGLSGESLNGKQVARARNHHPTVKPIALMRWLCRLVTPPSGVVLDPFTGSGTTGCAAVLEGFNFIGIEREAEYVEIARKRVAHWASQTAEPTLFEAA